MFERLFFACLILSSSACPSAREAPRVPLTEAQLRARIPAARAFQHGLKIRRADDASLPLYVWMLDDAPVAEGLELSLTHVSQDAANSRPLMERRIIFGLDGPAAEPGRPFELTIDGRAVTLPSVSNGATKESKLTAVRVPLPIYLDIALAKRAEARLGKATFTFSEELKEAMQDFVQQAVQPVGPMPENPFEPRYDGPAPD